MVLVHDHSQVDTGARFTPRLLTLFFMIDLISCQLVPTV